MNYATVLSKHKVVVRLVTLVVFLNFAIPPQAISAAQSQSQAFKRNVAPAKALATSDQEKANNRIPEEFFDSSSGDDDFGDGKLTEFVINGNFETPTSFTPPIYDPYMPFAFDEVYAWQDSHGTPQIKPYFKTEPDHYAQLVTLCDSNHHKGEGIFANVALVSGEEYVLQFNYKLVESEMTSPRNDLFICLFNADPPGLSGSNQEPVPAVMTPEGGAINIYEAYALAPDAQWHTANVTFTAPTDVNYIKLGIYGKSDGSITYSKINILIDDVSITPQGNVITVQTDGTLGAEVKNILTGEQGAILTYNVAEGDPFYGEFDPLPPASHTFKGWKWEASDDPTLIIDIKNVTENVTATALFEIKKLTLTYTAGAGGRIKGPSPQVIPYGNDGKPVTAVPDNQHQFVNWSDGSTMNPRHDLDVTANIDVVANFEPIVQNYKVSGYAYINFLWDKDEGQKDYSGFIPFIGGEIVVIDPKTQEIIENLGIVTDEQGYFEFTKPAHWSGSIAVYRPANGQILFDFVLLYPLNYIADLTADTLIYNFDTTGIGGHLPQKIWHIGYFNMEPYITGKVTDEQGNPVAGVKINSWGTSSSYYTDEQGEYKYPFIMFHPELWEVVTPEDDDPNTVFDPPQRTLKPMDRDYYHQDFVMITADQGKKK